MVLVPRRFRAGPRPPTRMRNPFYRVLKFLKGRHDWGPVSETRPWACFRVPPLLKVHFSTTFHYP